jgi:hypothetical protein
MKLFVILLKKVGSPRLDLRKSVSHWWVFYGIVRNCDKMCFNLCFNFYDENKFEKKTIFIIFLRVKLIKLTGNKEHLLFIQ